MIRLENGRLRDEMSIALKTYTLIKTKSLRFKRAYKIYKQFDKKHWQKYKETIILCALERFTSNYVKNN